MNLTPVDRPAALAALVEEYRDVPFAWGLHDCCLWAAKAVEIQTGRDPAADFRGIYTTARQARDLIAARFGGNIENIPGRLGFASVPVALCQRGWLVSKQFPHRGVALGVCIGNKAAFAGKRGLIFSPLSGCRRAWALPL